MRPRVFGAALVLAALAPWCRAPFAQEVEPNNSCSALPHAVHVAIPGTLRGSLDEGSATAHTDVDFFFLHAPPGEVVRATSDTTGRIGLYDRSCRRLAMTNDPTRGIEFTVPADGIVALAVGSSFDGELDGEGAVNTGPYRLVLHRPHPFVPQGGLPPVCAAPHAEGCSAER